jgi:hypothetical protein
MAFDNSLDAGMAAPEGSQKSESGQPLWWTLISHIQAGRILLEIASSPK